MRVALAGLGSVRRQPGLGETLQRGPQLLHAAARDAGHAERVRHRQQPVDGRGHGLWGRCRCRRRCRRLGLSSGQAVGLGQGYLQKIRLGQDIQPGLFRELGLQLLPGNRFEKAGVQNQS